MAWIKITDDRYGESFRTGVNGLLYDIPLNTPVNVEDVLADHIKGLGVACEDAEAPEGARGSKEGSGDVLAPIAVGMASGGGAVEQPAMRTKSLNSGSGSQPGDVTGSAASGDEEEAEAKEAPSQNQIEERSAVSDVRVQGERRSGRDASVAEIAGEGEQGTTPAGGGVGTTSRRETAQPKEAAAQERVAQRNERERK